MRWLYIGCSVFLTSFASAQDQNAENIANKQLELKQIQEIEQEISKIKPDQDAFNKSTNTVIILQEERANSAQEPHEKPNQVKFAQETVKIMAEIEGFEGSGSDSIIFKDQKTPRLSGPSQYDSRIEPIQLNLDVDWQNELFTVSTSVGMLVEIENLQQVSKTIYQLDISQKLGEKLNLCKDEAFYNQPSIGVGTAFIFNQKSMLTALHVLERPLRFYVVVFNYKIISENGVVDAFVAEDDIYYPQHLVKKNDELDIVEFSVDRNFNRSALLWENSKNIKKENSEVYTIGFPSGLPMKIALNASILEDDHPFYYYTSLDSFQGNSGSPVFNFYTHKVIGVLVSGELDYRFNGNCNESPVCRYPYCKGEKVIRIEEILNNL